MNQAGLAMADESRFSRPKVLRATRLSLAMVISFLYAALTGMSNGTWVIMTCAIILFDNETLGGTLNKSYLRFLGTLFSAAFAMLFIILFANNIIMNVIAIVIGVFLATYWFMDSSYAYAGGLMVWTLPILLLNSNNIKEPFIRLFNISLGILISYGLLRFFFPEYARDNLLRAMHKTLSEMQSILHDVVQTDLNPHQIQERYLKQEPVILGQINHFLRLQKEARAETKHEAYVDTAVHAFLHIRRLLRLLSIFIFYFDDGSIQDDPKIYEKFIRILQQIDLIIRALERNHHEYYVPKELRHYAKRKTPEGGPESVHYQELSSIIIADIILDELKVVGSDLNKFFRIRKENRYH